MTTLLGDMPGPLAELSAELAHLRATEEGLALVQGNLPALAGGYAFAASLDNVSRGRIRKPDLTSAAFRQFAALCPWPVALHGRRRDMMRAAAMLMLAIAKLDAETAAKVQEPADA